MQLAMQSVRAPGIYWFAVPRSFPAKFCSTRNTNKSVIMCLIALKSAIRVPFSKKSRIEMANQAKTFITMPN
jgi:hypothetical protein